MEKVNLGKVLCACDTLGQHYWGGFEESVGLAFHAEVTALSVLIGTDAD